jgi:S1-C subfamily serine protease
VEELGPSIVFIAAQFGETAIGLEGLGSGTGVVYDLKNGYIVTNAHVIEGASAVKVAPANSNKYRSARIVGRSQCDDLAVLKVDNTAGLKEAPLGDSTRMKVGADVLALGYPEAFELGNDLTVTSGTVSKMGTTRYQHEDLIQHNAALAHGNSGGALVNRRGEVIGINTLIFYTAQGEREPGINFSIAMSHARPIIRDLEQGKNRHYIGLNLYPNAFAEYFGTEKGLVVAGVASGGPGSQAGIQPADLLLKIENSEVNSEEAVCDILRSHADGDQLKVQVFRKTTGEILEGELTMGKVGAANDKTQKIGAIAQVGQEESSDGQGDDNSQSDDQSSDADVEIVVNNNFDDNEAGPWGVAEESTFSAGVADGKYVLNVTAPDNRVSSYPSGTPAENMPDGGVFALVQAQGDGVAGVMARYAKSGENENMYGCWIKNDSTFACFKMIDGAITNLVQPGESTAIKPDESNQIGLVAIGNELLFQINDENVASFTDASLKEGAWGVMASTPKGSNSFIASYDEIAIVRPK